MADGLHWLDPKSPRQAGNNKHVLIARVVLPVIAVFLLVASFIWSQMGPDVEVKKIDLKDVQNTLQTARFTSIDKDGQPFVIEADQVIQQDPSTMAATLAKPTGELSRKDGGKISLKAKDGVYEHNEQKLHLDGDVVLEQKGDMTMTTDTLDIDLGGKNAKSAKPVQAVTPAGDTLNAQGMDLRNGGDQIIFTGPATLTLAPKGKKLETTTEQ